LRNYSLVLGHRPLNRVFQLLLKQLLARKNGNGPCNCFLRNYNLVFGRRPLNRVFQLL